MFFWGGAHMREDEGGTDVCSEGRAFNNLCESTHLTFPDSGLCVLSEAGLQGAALTCRGQP